MNEILRILLIDDNPDDCLLTIRALRREFPDLQVEQITEAKGFAQALEAGDFDLAITDYQLRWSDGLAVLRAVRARWPDCPVIMFTATGSEEIAVEAMKNGLDDYVLKSPKHFIRLPAAVRSALKRAEDSIERKRAEEELRESEERYHSLFEGVPAGLYRTMVGGQILDANPALVEMLGYPDWETLLAVNVTDLYVDPEDRQRWQALIEREGVVRDFEVQWRRRGGTTIWVKDTARVVWAAEGRVLYYEGSLEDITERKRAEEEVRRHLERIEALREIDRAITSTLDLTEVLDIILEELERVIPYHSAAIFLLSDGTAKLTAGRGFPDLERALQISFLVKEDALTRELLQEKRPLVLADAQADERFRARGDTGYVCSWIGVPLIAKERAVGFLTIDHREPGVYDEDSADMAQAFAGQVAIAIENARLYEEAQRELAERKRAEEELQHTLERLREALGGIIQTVALTVETKDPYTAGHQRRVGNLARAIANEMGLPQEQIDGIRMAGLIHDLGKVGIPTEILGRPGPLNDLQFGLIKAHSQIGYDVLKTIEFPWPVAQIVLQHHERLDGSGYPQGLSGEETLLEARILAVADVVEAMASRRPYRPPRGLDKALEEISQNSGILYDAEAVDACLKLFTEKGFEFE